MIINSQMVIGKIPKYNIKTTIYSHQAPFSSVYIIPQFDFTISNSISSTEEIIPSTADGGYNLQYLFSKLSEIYVGKNEILLNTLIDFSQGNKIVKNQFSTLGTEIQKYFLTNYSNRKIQIKKIFRISIDEIAILFNDNNSTNKYLIISFNGFKLNSVTQ